MATRAKGRRPPLRTSPKGLTYAQGRPHGVYSPSATISAGKRRSGPHPGAQGRTWASKRDADLDRRTSGGSLNVTGPKGPSAGQRARRAAGAPLRGARAVTGAGTVAGRYSARGLLTAELLTGAGIVAIRAVADYEPQADGTLKGKIGHPAGQYGPLPILAGLIGTFFLLSFLAARGGTRAKVAVIAGGLIVLVLGMKSVTEMTTVSDTFGSFGTAKTPAGDWQTSGTQSGTPVEGNLAGSTSSSSDSSSSSSGSGSFKTGTLGPGTPVASE